MWIDSHCHLNHDRFEGRVPSDIVMSAKNNGVDGMVNISCQITGDFPRVLNTAQKHDNVWCTVGTHPHDAGLEGDKDVSQADLIQLAGSDPKIIAIGETGLDYYYKNATLEDQEHSFRKHIRACIETDLPIIIHARDADDDIERILFKEEGANTGLKGVMHCFSSGAELAEAAVEFGFYISFSGILTFKSADALRDIAKKVPIDRLLVETDAPFLAPVPHRGAINEPGYVAHTGKVLADIHGVSVVEMAKVTTENFCRLFKVHV